MYRKSRSVGGCTWHTATGGYVKSLTLRYRIMLNFATTCAICNSSDLGVCPYSMPVNWKGRVAMRVLGRQSKGDFQSIDAKSTSWSTSSPVKDFAPAALSSLSPIRRPRRW